PRRALIVVRQHDLRLGGSPTLVESSIDEIAAVEILALRRMGAVDPTAGLDVAMPAPNRARFLQLTNRQKLAAQRAALAAAPLDQPHRCHALPLSIRIEALPNCSPSSGVMANLWYMRVTNALPRAGRLEVPIHVHPSSAPEAQAYARIETERH